MTAVSLFPEPSWHNYNFLSLLASQISLDTPRAAGLSKRLTADHPITIFSFLVAIRGGESNAYTGLMGTQTAAVFWNVGAGGVGAAGWLCGLRLRTIHRNDYRHGHGPERAGHEGRKRVGAQR